MKKFTAIIRRAETYTALLMQVKEYREQWEKKLKQFILNRIDEILKVISIGAHVEVEEKITGLQVISVKLGKKASGIFQQMEDGTAKHFIKDYGTLYYSQLFNGKVQVWMTYPVIEGMMEPRPPIMLGIYAPPEFIDGLISGNFDRFLKELAEWENYDDDPPTKKIGFGVEK
jgi:hypothetical protein